MDYSVDKVRAGGSVPLSGAQDEWRPWAQRLAAELRMLGYLHGEWHDAFAETPRHRLLPVVGRLGSDVPEWWWELVYSDNDLSDLTSRLDRSADRRLVPTSVGVGPEWSPAPRIVAWLLGLLVPGSAAVTGGGTDAAAAPRVLIAGGSGHGYAVALACHRLGDHQVTATERYRPNELRAQLAELGLRPTVVHAMGVRGASLYGPVDSVLRLPTRQGPSPQPAAFEALRAALGPIGGRVVVPYHDGDGVVRARVDDQDETGAVVARTMTLHGVVHGPDHAEYPAPDGTAGTG